VRHCTDFATGSLTPNAKGDYSSSLEVSGTTFTATYVFGPAAVADGVPDVVADGGGERLLSWMVRGGHLAH
jgi:hypothetical protein